jgi:tripartite-type tricarboxylate transporter receptor subunit TctC
MGDAMISAPLLARRRFLQLAAATALTRPALAQTYPTRPVRIVVPIAPGGAADISARLMGQWLSERLGQSFVIENRPGGSNNIGTEAVIRSPADGYTLLLANPVNAINETLYANKLNFNFLADTTAVGAIMLLPLVMVVNPSVPARTVPEFIAYAKANPGKVNMASGGNGATGHVAGELFKMQTGVSMVHVPYRGEAPALTDLIGGQVQVTFVTIPSAIQYIRAGILRALAVTTAQRAPALPDVPVMAEVVPGYDASAWNGFVAPKATPADIIERLNTEMNAGLADPKIKTRLAELGCFPFPGSAAAFNRFIADDTQKWGKVVKFSGAKAD